MGLANMGDYGLSPMPKTMDNGAGGGDWWTENMPHVQDAAAPTSAPTPQAGAPNGDVQAFIQQWQQSHAPSEGIAGLTAALKAAGYPVDPYMYGSTASNNEISLNGQKYKVLGGEGTPAAYWYKPGTNDSAGGSVSSGTVGGTAFDPWTQNFQERSPQEIANDPGYQFQMAQGLQGIERGAAAKGTLLTGGTLKDLAGFGQGLASTYGDKYFARDQWKYLTSRDNFQMNQDRPWAKGMQLATLGKPSGS